MSQAKNIQKQEIALALVDIGALKFGEFIYKSGIKTGC